MFWTILLILLCLAVVTLAVLLCAPMALCAQYASEKGRSPRRFSFTFGHWWLVRVEYGFDTGRSNVYVLNRRLAAKADDRPESPPPSSYQGPQDQPSTRPQPPPSGRQQSSAGEPLSKAPGDEMREEKDERKGRPHIPSGPGGHAADGGIPESDHGSGRIESGGPEPIREHRPPQEKTPKKPSEPSTPSPALSVDEGGEPADGGRRVGKKSWRQRLDENKYVFLLRQQRLRRKIIGCLGRTLCSLSRLIAFDRLEVRMKGSAGDPVATGIAYGSLVALRQGLQFSTARHMVLEVEPSFEREEFIDWEGRVAIRTSLGRLLFPALVLVVTFPYLSAFLTWRRMKKRGML